MKALLIKYSVAVLAIAVVARLLSVLVLEIYPDLLMVELEDGYWDLGVGSLDFYLTTLLNIPLTIYLGKDLKRINLQSIPLQVFTVLSNVGGVIIFLLVSQYHEIQTKKYESVAEKTH